MRFLAVVLLLAGVSLTAQDAPQKKGGGPGRGGPPKNLKILKPEEVGPNMRAYTAALGQRCDFCHVPTDFSLDDKEQKLTARKMIEMVNHINGQFPDGKVHVTC